jgi:hypothetical protein
LTLLIPISDRDKRLRRTKNTYTNLQKKKMTRNSSIEEEQPLLSTGNPKIIPPHK